MLANLRCADEKVDALEVKVKVKVKVKATQFNTQGKMNTVKHTRSAKTNCASCYKDS